MLRKAKADEGMITGETSVNYLWFCDRDYEKLGSRIKCNPSVKTEGLKKNAILLIPCTEQKRAVIRESQPARKADRKAESQEYIIHTAKWYEDLDTIAEKYGVTVESIQQANGLTGRFS